MTHDHTSTPAGEGPSRPPDEIIVFAPPPAADRWPHRRGEPRLFALAWTIYLLGATVACYGQLIWGGVIDPLSARFAARELLVLVAVGVSILWPALRLSQVLPREGGVAATSKDLFVVAVPSQAVVWPLSMLALWPVWTVAAIAASLFAWTALIGGALAFALGPAHADPARPQGAWTRPAWAAAFVALATAGPLLSVGWPSSSSRAVALAWLASPATGLLEIARDRSWSGEPTAFLAEHAVALAVVLALAGAAWVLASARERARVAGPR
ncbi:MAG: hypothetical protein HRU70_00155 [Phycisphaeraceae bacterium]|nr:MAG: hypothetical protein HRU70_00155 [Phycisphaeraceae bacterium]